MAAVVRPFSVAFSALIWANRRAQVGWLVPTLGLRAFDARARRPYIPVCTRGNVSRVGRYLIERYMTQGTVKWFNGQKGFGFIQPADGGNDVFVHISAVERAGMSNLNEGQKISFDVVPNPKNGKSSAENLRAV